MYWLCLQVAQELASLEQELPSLEQKVVGREQKLASLEQRLAEERRKWLAAKDRAALRRLLVGLLPASFPKCL